MDQAIDALGNFKAANFHHHIGPDSHITHYPVANNTMLNVTGFVLDPNEWPDVNNMVASGSRDALVESFKGWNPSVLALLNLLPEDPIRWAVFDTWDYPAPFYNRGRMCLVGDAAHASSPHHGGGAGIGIEDVLCLATVIGQVVETCRGNPQVKDRALTAALGIYDSLRRTRSQWLVNSSRRACDLYHLQEWADPAKWIKAQTVFEEIKDRSHKLWNFNSQKMIDETIAAYKLKREEILGAVPAKVGA
jgi:salicylate hydroxylase